jgi:hypothetical protein
MAFTAFFMVAQRPVGGRRRTLFSRRDGGITAQFLDPLVNRSEIVGGAGSGHNSLPRCGESGAEIVLIPPETGKTSLRRPIHGGGTRVSGCAIKVDAVRSACQDRGHSATRERRK